MHGNASGNGRLENLLISSVSAAFYIFIFSLEPKKSLWYDNLIPMNSEAYQ
jgi:hypothetical protein